METYPIKTMLDYADQNQNGLIDRVDFRLMECGGIRPGRGRPRCYYQSGQDKLWDFYAKYILVADKDGDDKLSMEEIFDKTNTYLELIFKTLKRD